MNKLREQVIDHALSKGVTIGRVTADELITIIGNAKLDEVKDAFSGWQDGASPLDSEDFNNAIDELRGSDEQ